MPTYELPNIFSALQYNWYHGGKYQFIQWHGIPFQGTGADITPPDVGAFFYNTTAIVDSFKRYITRHLNVSY
jgi:mannan endo-1,4-beta-mannosidase